MEHPQTRIAIIEDDEDTRIFLNELLEGVGYEVRAYESYPRTIVDMRNGWIPDVFIVDYNYAGRSCKGSDIIRGFREADLLKNSRYILKSDGDISPLEKDCADYFMQLPKANEEIVIMVKEAELGMQAVGYRK